MSTCENHRRTWFNASCIDSFTLPSGHQIRRRLISILLSNTFIARTKCRPVLSRCFEFTDVVNRGTCCKRSRLFPAVLNLRQPTSSSAHRLYRRHPRERQSNRIDCFSIGEVGARKRHPGRMPVLKTVTADGLLFPTVSSIITLRAPEREVIWHR